MSNITLNLNLGGTGGAEQSQAADEDTGSSTTDKIASIMKKITRLQKQAAELQGPPDEVAKMRKVIEQEIKALEMQMKQLMDQEAKKNQAAADAAKEDKPGDVASPSLRKIGTGTRRKTPDRLPARCPERHINGDGTFCMYWQGEMSLKIDSEEAARTWWSTLLGYLKLQERAEKLKRWPDDNAWAHGNAALHQQKAIAAAARISPQLETEVKRKRVQAKQKGPHGLRPQMIYVSRQGNPFYSVRILLQPTYKATVTRLRQPCLCGLKKRKKGKPIALRKCPRHADDARDLAIELVKWEKEEEKFWASYKGRQCCGKMASCPLAANGIIATGNEVQEPEDVGAI